MDEAFSVMDADIQDLADEETDKVLFEVAQMRLAGTSFVIKCNK